MLDPVLLRSLIAVDAADDHGLLRANLAMVRSEIEPDGIDGVILSYIGSVVDRAQQTPSLPTLTEHFERKRDAGDPEGGAALIRLADITPVAHTPVLDAAAFRVLLDAYIERVYNDVMGALLVDAANILRFGVQKNVRTASGWQQQTIRGVHAAIAHVAQGLAQLQAKFRRGSVSSLHTATERIWSDFLKAEANPMEQFGVLSGLEKIDEAHKGLKRGELALVLGFVGHMKTSFLVNWIYKAAVFYGKSVATATLEMPVDQIEKLMAVIHTSHPKFDAAGIPLITTEAVRSGKLTPEQKTLFRAALDDLRDNRDYGRLHWKHPEARLTMEEIGHWANGYAQAGEPVDLIAIDYLGLVDPHKQSTGLDQFSNLNKVIREAKLLALEYGQGRGVPVLSPFQANREGFKDAEKNGGKYTLRALAGANESERSADYVYFVWLDDSLRQQNELVVGNLKTRSGPIITDFRVMADAATRLIDNLQTGGAAASALGTP